MKKILNILIAGLLALTVLGCQSQEEVENLDFDTWADGLVLRVLSTDSISFNFYFVNPEESLGVSKTTIEWPTYDVDEYLETVEEYDAIYEELLSFDRDSLSDSQKETYDVLEFTFRPVDEEYIIPFYYLSNNVLGNYVGLLSDPIIDLFYLNVYDEIDIQNYIHLMETLEDFAYELLAFEQERQDNGYGMTPEEIELSIESVTETLEVGDFSYLAEDFAEKVEAIDLDEDTKEAYIEFVDGSINEVFTNFYEILLEGLENLDVKQESGVTLYDLPYGTEYYAALVYEYTGIEDMDEFYIYLVSLINEVSEELLLVSDEDYEDAYIDLDTADEVIAYLKEAMAEDFPDAADVEYQMIETPDGLAALMGGTAAYYLLPSVDDVTGSQSLAIVGEYDKSKFTTIAHEGYPGHMYQNVYMASLDLPYIRVLLSNSGYSEGYASYAEYYSVKYSADPESGYISTLWTQYTYYIIVMADYYMHYAGEDAESFLSYFFSGSVSSLYKQLQMSPAIFVKYDISAAIIADMREEIEEAIGEEITDLEFHTAILSHGKMPLHLLREYVIADFTE